MIWLSETLALARMLFSSKPSDMAAVEVVDMAHYPFSGYKAMQWCGRIIHRKGASAMREVDINHENIHLAQAKDEGSWIRFYLKYLLEWLRGGVFIRPASAAYYTSRYEVEAYAKEEDKTYLERRGKGNVDLFTIEPRKKIFRELGREKFKTYIKELFRHL